MMNKKIDWIVRGCCVGALGIGIYSLVTTRMLMAKEEFGIEDKVSSAESYNINPISEIVNKISNYYDKIKKTKELFGESIKKFSFEGILEPIVNGIEEQKRLEEDRNRERYFNVG